MCSMNDFGEAVHEILENNYLKDNFENLETRDLVLTFWNIQKENSPKKISSVLSLNSHNLKIVTRKTNEHILKSSDLRTISFKCIAYF